ncbi:MAG: transposase, partial [Bacilli bacterium]
AIKFKNKYYQPYENERIKCFVSKTKCLVIESFNHDLFVTIDDQIFELKELIRNAKYSVEFEEVPIIKERKKYIPPMSHPFKLKSFQTQMRKSHNEYKYA